jgi:hypothetical protein
LKEPFSDSFPFARALTESLADIDFYGGLIDQLASAAWRKGEVDEHSLNFMLSVVKGIEPKD